MCVLDQKDQSDSSLTSVFASWSLVHRQLITLNVTFCRSYMAFLQT